MPSSRTVEKTAIQTGVTHFALSVASFGAVTLVGGGLVQLFGSDKAASPTVNIALFTPQSGPAPYLKARLDAPAAPEGAPSIHYGNDWGGGDENAPAAAAGVRITEQPDLDRAAAPKASALPKAPIEAFVERTAAGVLPKIGPDGRTPAEIYARPFAKADGPKISLIVGGLGLNKNETAAAIDDLPAEITLSFVPYASNLQALVDRARASGHEVLLELPMEPYDYPNVDTGPETLLTTASPTENDRRLKVLLGKATGYFGVTNYQGAKFATDARAAGPVLAALKQRGLAFIHDGAAARSALPETARSKGLSLTAADRIVDSEPSADAIDAQLLQLEALAIQNGHALGMAFAYPVTIEQLGLWAKGLKSKGYTLAPASSAAGVRALSPGGRS